MPKLFTVELMKEMHNKHTFVEAIWPGEPPESPLLIDSSSIGLFNQVLPLLRPETAEKVTTQCEAKREHFVKFIGYLWSRSSFR